MNLTRLQKIKIPTSEAGMRLERWLKQKLPRESYGSLQKLVRTGQVRVEGKRAQANAVLHEGQEVRLPPRPLFILKSSPKTEIDPKWIQEIQRRILYEDDHVLIVNKPAGLAVQGGTRTKISLDKIAQALPVPYAAGLRLTHRLDKDTSGVLILAKTARDAAWITEQFKENKISKTYWALAIGKPPKSSGLIDLPLSKRPTKRGEKIEIDPAQGLQACTYYQLKAYRQGISWIEFCPQTGRTHQIRVHSAALGCPILGDGKYGGQKAHPLKKRVCLHLHAYRVQIVFPGGEARTFMAPLAPDMQKTFEHLGFSFEN